MIANVAERYTGEYCRYFSSSNTPLVTTALMLYLDPVLSKVLLAETGMNAVYHVFVTEATVSFNNRIEFTEHTV